MKVNTLKNHEINLYKLQNTTEKSNSLIAGKDEEESQVNTNLFLTGENCFLLSKYNKTF